MSDGKTTPAQTEKAKEVAAPAPAPVQDANKRNILLVDDSFLIRRLQKEILEKLGFAVTETSNGKEALDKVSERGAAFFSLLIIDLMMPVMNGVEFIVKAQEAFGEQLPPLLVCSSKAEVPLIKKLVSLGIKGFLIKPIDPTQFTKKIKEVLPS